MVLAVNADELIAYTTLGLAVATFLLAAFAGWLAWLTRRAIEISRESLRVAQAELLGTLRPLLVAVPVGRFLQTEEIHYRERDVGVDHVGHVTDRGRIHSEQAADPRRQDRHVLSIPLRNVGPGVAVMYVPLPAYRRAHDTAWYQGRPTMGVVPSGEIVRLNFIVGTEDHAILVEAAYRDVAGEQFTKTSLWVTREPPGREWSVRGYALYANKQERPFLWSGEGWDSTGREETP